MEKKVPRLGPVKCRVCKKTIDRNVEVEGTDWIQPSRNYDTILQDERNGIES